MVTAVDLREKWNTDQVDFLRYFYPEINNLGDERSLEGFSMFIGFNYNNNKTFCNLPFTERYYTLDEIENLHIPEEACVYFTPNLFKSFTAKRTSIKRKVSSLMWLTSLYLDIDGIKGITDPSEALDILFAACDKAGIKRPNIINHTSTNPDVRLQVFWLLDPMYIKNDGGGVIKDRLSWWKDSIRALSHQLQAADPRLLIDNPSSIKPTGYFRLPGTYNQKTGEKVSAIYMNITDVRYTLEDYWLTNICDIYYSYLKKEANDISCNNRYTSGIEVLKHEQIKLLLNNGVPKNYRNKAVYALTKACYADGLSYKETIEVIAGFNEKCRPSVPYGELIYWVKSSYGVIGAEKGCLRDINPVIVADLVNAVFGTNFKPDNALKIALRRQISRNKRNIGDIRGKYMSKQETKTRVISVINSFILAGNLSLPSQKDLAMIAGVKYNSMTRYWKDIKEAIYNKYKVIIYSKGRNNAQVLKQCSESQPIISSFFDVFSLLCKIPNNKSIVSAVYLILANYIGRGSP